MLAKKTKLELFLVDLLKYAVESYRQLVLMLRASTSHSTYRVIIHDDDDDDDDDDET